MKGIVKRIDCEINGYKVLNRHNIISFHSTDIIGKLDKWKTPSTRWDKERARGLCPTTPYDTFNNSTGIRVRWEMNYKIFFSDSCGYNNAFIIFPWKSLTVKKGARKGKLRKMLSMREILFVLGFLFEWSLTTFLVSAFGLLHLRGGKHRCLCFGFDGSFVDDNMSLWKGGK